MCVCIYMHINITYICVYIYIHTLVYIYTPHKQGNKNLVISHIGKNVENSHKLLGEMCKHLAALENCSDVSNRRKNADARHSFLLRERGAYSESNIRDYDPGTWIQNPQSNMPH